MYQNQNNPNQQQNTGAQQNQQSNSRGNRTVVPEAKGALNQMKYEIASDWASTSSRAITRSAFPSGGLYRRLYDQAPHRAGGTRHERTAVSPSFNPCMPGTIPICGDGSFLC